MRKRISCKIIKSVPLNTGDNRPGRSCVTNLQQPKSSETGTSTYTPRMVVTKTCIDDKSAARFLDCCA